MSASETLARIVQMVAELTRADRAGEDPATLEQLATRHGVSTTQVAADLGTLTLLGEHADAEWLLSLSVWQQGDRVSVRSGGPFRRPLVLTPIERLAIQAALALDPEGAELARRFGRVGAVPVPETSLTSATADPFVAVRAAALAGTRLTLEYAGADDPNPKTWVAEPHQLVEYRRHRYAICWCPETEDWRHFRLDRILAATDLGVPFNARPDFRPVARGADVFRPPGGAGERVRVRFGPGVARWVKERYAEWEEETGGGLVATMTVASEAWLVRRVLEYGDQAEVVGPKRYRDAVRRAVA